MNKNRRQEKKNNTPRLKLIDNIERCTSKCSSSKTGHELDGGEAHKSRVTIFGQLGLTEDDRYILNCAATLNDKPIRSNYMYMDKNTSPYRRETNKDIKTMATQATQVNFNISKQIPKKNYENKTVQCYCMKTCCTNQDTYVSESETESVELKQCKSPIVVISVYPRQDLVQNISNTNPVKIIHRPISPQNKLSKTNQGKNAQTKSERKLKTRSTNLTSEHKPIKTRSPSPESKKLKIKNADTSFTRINNNAKKLNAPRQKSPIKSPIKSVHKFNDFKQNMCNIDKNYKCLRKQELGKPQRDIIEVNKEQVKKALVNSFFENVNKRNKAFEKNKSLDPKEDASKITINIDGEKEHYNVSLEQRNFDTGITVQKTVKARQSSKRNNDKVDEKYMKNVLILSDNVENEDRGNRQNARRCRQTYYVPYLLASESRLNVKDSLEVCHRREERNSSRIELNKREKNTINGPNKHYRGDNCSISDPNERDREIRELLGILRDKRYLVQQEPKINFPRNYNGHYGSRTKRSKGLSTGLSDSKFPSNKRSIKVCKKEKFQCFKMESIYNEAGQRKCVTPNLGTSTFSLNSNGTNGSNYSIKPPPYSGDGMIKKPFLKRLLSCLVMRSAQTSQLKNKVKRRKQPSQNSSLDSYYISSSLGALDMSSSVYDTSASFYSNHTISPSNKTKKGFFNSMRGFLTSKRN